MFLRVGAGSAALAMLPLTGCTTGSSLPPIETTGGPTTVTADGVRFEARPNAHALLITNARGDLRTGGVGHAAGKFNYPVGVATLGGLAYIVERGNHRVQVIDASGASVRMIGETELFYPGDIAVTAEQELLVADSRNARVVGFTADGELTRELGKGTLSAPSGLTVIDDSILVADPGLHEVLELDRSGAVRRKLGAGWVLPWSVATDGERVFVIDGASPVIAVLDRSGRRVETLELDRPASYVSYVDGTLFVS